MPVSLDKGLLVNILSILLIPEHMQRQPQYTLVVTSNQRVEGGTLAFLRLADQLIVLDPLLCPSLKLRLRQLAIPGGGLGSSLCHWQRFYRQSKRTGTSST